VERPEDDDDVDIDVAMEIDNEQQKTYKKKLEVLSVMFPEISTETLEEVYSDFDQNLQTAVEYLLQRKRQRDGAHSNERSTYENEAYEERFPRRKSSPPSIPSNPNSNSCSRSSAPTTITTTKRDENSHRIESIIKQDDCTPPASSETSPNFMLTRRLSS